MAGMKGIQIANYLEVRWGTGQANWQRINRIC